jgi:hypothetical protein
LAYIHGLQAAAAAAVAAAPTVWGVRGPPPFSSAYTREEDGKGGGGRGKEADVRVLPVEGGPAKQRRRIRLMSGLDSNDNNGPMGKAFQRTGVYYCTVPTHSKD